MRLRATAPAKVNLSLFLGERRSDGRHELVTLFESVSLCDELELTTIDGADAVDQVLCPGVEGPNLVSAALQSLREHGWSAPPVRIEIDKRIPVAAGMGGGSADAAATLRLARVLEPLPLPITEQIARALGADVPSQLVPGICLGTGAGDRVTARARLAPHAFVIVPQQAPLSTPAVYQEADRLGLPRAAAELLARRGALERELRLGARPPAELLANDLEPAAVSLRSEVADSLEAVRAAGAETVLVCGSGPTVAGIWWGERAQRRARKAAAALAGRWPGASWALPTAAGEGMPQFR